MQQKELGERPVTSDWESFDTETANQLALWHAYLGLWNLEVLSTRCAWQLWPSAATRKAYVFALSEREKCAATLQALEGFRRADSDEPDPFREYQPD